MTEEPFEEMPFDDNTSLADDDMFQHEYEEDYSNEFKDADAEEEEE